MVWVEKNLKDHPVPTPLPWAGTPFTKVAQSPIQCGLLKVWAFIVLSTYLYYTRIQCYWNAFSDQWM